MDFTTFVVVGGRDEVLYLEHSLCSQIVGGAFDELTLADAWEIARYHTKTCSALH